MQATRAMLYSLLQKRWLSTSLVAAATLVSSPIANADSKVQTREADGHAARSSDLPKVQSRPTPKSGTDHSGQRRVGKASFYHDMFYGRKMANGKPMRPQDDNAASKTLPLGTTARVTNLETGKSTVVTIEDRGPYVDGRIVDLSPSSAREIGLTREQGLAPVEVVPIEVPLPDGTVKMGAGADAGPVASGN